VVKYFLKIATMNLTITQETCKITNNNYSISHFIDQQIILFN